VVQQILLTSFATWKAHQMFNSSDQLLVELANSNLGQSLSFLRYLPVNLPVARSLTVGKIQRVQPNLLVCCGMAESRLQLNVEAQATVGNSTLKPRIDLAKLTAELDHTLISQDAGRFVCNSLYHAMLNYFQSVSLNQDCLFIHVPLLTPENREPIFSDFRQLIERLLAIESLS
jgi:pyroglutamyl-peptidase